MNCLEARREFAGFWRRSLSEDDRGALLTHLWGCDSCDHSFRVFALTAPVLHGAPPERRREHLKAASNPPEPSAARPGGSVRAERRRIFAAAFVMGAAAAVALYFSAPPRVTLEDAINSGGSAVTNSTQDIDNLFGRDDLERDSAAPEGSKLDFGQGREHGFAS
ncbi:MAG TPA: hypothetical protein VKS22_05775 [Candidatus Binataceae bacterium]|nr:hypothetical protein [Candidatus Binataceae bacterium]